MRSSRAALALVLAPTLLSAQTRLVDREPISVDVSATREFSASVPDGTTHVTLSLQRNTTLRSTLWDDPATRVRVQSLISLDGGATWLGWCGFIAEGGLRTRATDSTEMSESAATCPMPARASRRVRVRVTTLSGPTLTSEVTVEVATREVVDAR